MQKSVYRPDIDGLRALAILPIVWFHSGLPGLPGGFTGVDTFFVISGFLITSIIHREVAAGVFTYAGFYERRVRRIAPALLAVITVTLATGFTLLLPSELIALGKSAIAAVLMVPNVYFWREAGYFALGEGITPLLHTWSLGVEEQFYLFFPPVLFLAERWKVVQPAVIVIAVASFVLCLIGTNYSPSATFYLLPTRAWELMLGAVLAVGALSIPLRLRPYAAGAGLALLAASVFYITKATAFPGWRAALPAVGAMLLIGSGPDTRINRAIANRAFVWIGKSSYSLYLWHWPIFAFVRHFRADPVLPVPVAIAAIALSFLLAWATYRWIEQPARQSSTRFLAVGRRAVVVAGAAVCVSGILIIRSGIPQRFPAEVLAIASRSMDIAPLAHSCVNVPLERINSECAVGLAGRASFVLWGDSHAAAISEAVGIGLSQPGVVASMNSCAATGGWTSSTTGGRDPSSCRARNAAILDQVLSDARLQTVVLASYWPAHARNGGASMWRSVQNVVDRLRRSGKTVIVVAGIPEPGTNVPWANAIRARFKRPPATWACPPAAIPLQGVLIVDVAERFCAESEQSALFTDGNHPSRTAGILAIVPAIRATLRERPAANATLAVPGGGLAAQEPSWTLFDPDVKLRPSDSRTGEKRQM